MDFQFLGFFFLQVTYFQESFWLWFSYIHYTLRQDIIYSLEYKDIGIKAFDKNHI